MVQQTSWHDWNWPHLLLLALIYPAMTLSFALAPTLLMLVWLAFNLAVLGLAERCRPERLEWHATGADLIRDGSVLGLNLITDSLIKLALFALILFWAPQASAWPLLLQVLIGAALAELASYTLHRWSHQGGWLWRVHALHHRPERLNVANGLTAHPLNAAYDQFARSLVLLSLGISAPAITVIALFHLTQGLATHANVRGRLGWLNRVLGTAELHRLHHSTRAEEAGNFGTDLPWWDLLFGTYRSGPTPAQVGVFEPANYPGEHQLGALLRLPFASDHAHAASGQINPISE